MAGIKIDIKANTKDFAKKIRAIKKEVKDLNKEQKKAIQNAKSLGLANLKLSESTQRAELSAKRLSIQSKALNQREQKLIITQKNLSLQNEKLALSTNKLKLAKQKQILAEQKHLNASKKFNEASNKKVGILNKLKSVMSAKVIVLGAFRAGLKLASIAITEVVKAYKMAIDKGGKFEQTMANLKAVTQPTAKEFKALSNEAKRLGNSTVFSASQAGDAFVELGKLGFKTNQIIDSTASIMNLASGASETLSDSAIATATTLKQFQLDTGDTAKVTDIMAKSFTMSSLDMKKFTMSMKFAGTSASNTGISFKTTTSALATLADNGVHSSTAGTSLRQVFNRLGDETSRVGKLLMSKGVRATASFSEKMKVLSELGLDNSKVFKLFGQTAGTAASILIKGADKTRKYGEDLKWTEGKAKGFAKAMADIQLDTLQGDMKLLDSATEGFAISLFEAFGDSQRAGVQLLTELMGDLNSWTIENSEKISAFGENAFQAFKILVDMGSDALGITLKIADALGLTKPDFYSSTEDQLRSVNKEIRNNLALQKKARKENDGDALGRSKRTIQKFDKNAGKDNKGAFVSITEEATGLKKDLEELEKLKSDISQEYIDLSLRNFSEEDIKSITGLTNHTAKLIDSHEVLGKKISKNKKAKEKLTQDQSNARIEESKQAQVLANKLKSEKSFLDKINTMRVDANHKSILSQIKDDKKRADKRLQLEKQALKDDAKKMFSKSSPKLKKANKAIDETFVQKQKNVDQEFSSQAKQKQDDLDAQKKAEKEELIKSIKLEKLSQTLEGEKKLLEEDKLAKAELLEVGSVAMLDLEENTERKKLEIIKKYAKLSDDVTKKSQDMERQERLRTLNTTKQAMSAGFNVAQLFAGKNKALAISEALVNGALGITKTFATYGATPPGFIGAGLIASNTALQVQEISKQKFADGGLSGGRVNGNGTPRGDKISTSLSAGEFVVNQGVASQNMPLLNSLNNGSTSNNFSFSPVVNITSSESTEGSITTILNNQRDEFVDIMKDLQERGEFA